MEFLLWKCKNSQAQGPRLWEQVEFCAQGETLGV